MMIKLDQRPRNWIADALDGYLGGQRDWLFNYTERHRAGSRVGTAIAEGRKGQFPGERMKVRLP
jgi:hypothetical protein